jgi:hypothetical protein
MHINELMGQHKRPIAKKAKVPAQILRVDLTRGPDQMSDAAVAFAIFMLLLLAVVSVRAIRYKIIMRRVLAKGSWVQISNPSYEPLFYGQVVRVRWFSFLGFHDYTALRGLLLPEAFSAELVAVFNERFPGQKDAQGHVLVLALTAGNLIVTELLERGKTTELRERFPSMNEASAPRILIGSDDIGLTDEASKSVFDKLWRGPPRAES